MEPFALLALATAAGFVFNKITGRTEEKEPLESKELVYSGDIVARSAPDNRSEFDLSSIEVLPEYRLIKALVEHQFPLIFVTGGAGTGKSTLVRWMMREFSGSVLLGAPNSHIGNQHRREDTPLPLSASSRMDR